MKRIPNTETVRHLCHLHGGNQYYLLAGSETKIPSLVTDVINITLLSAELKSWCGMDIDVFNIQNRGTKAVNTLRNWIPLNLSFKNMTLTEG